MVIISLMILIITIASTSSVITRQSISNSTLPLGQGQIGVDVNKGALSTYPLVVGEGLSPILIARLTSIVFLFSGALSYNALYIQSIGSGLSLYSGLFQVTVLSQSFDLFLFILASILLLPWNVISKRTNELKSTLSNTSSHTLEQGKVLISYLSGPLVKEYSLILLFSVLGSSLLLSSGNLLSMYLSIELQSFGVYVLATIYRDSESSTNAGLKYFLLGGLSSCFILLGCVLIYSYTGLIYFEDIYSISNVLTTMSSSSFSPVGIVELEHMNSLINIPMVIQLGFIFIFVGFLFKISAAPFHNWAPDVYNDVPTIVTSWLTVMPKIAILILSLDILTTLNISSYSSSILSFIPNLLLISSFLSLMIGTIVGLAQIKIKRLLAYSTISHVGFLLLGLSLSTEDSMESLLFYIIQYSLTNLNTFLILLSFGYILSNNKGSVKDINYISELKGQFQMNPLLSLSLSLCLFSMAGIPPLVGFFAKAQILSSSILNGYYFISIIAILVSVISAYYYLQIIKIMHFDTSDHLTDSNENSASINSTINITNVKSSNIHSYLISLLTISITLFMLKPSIALNGLNLLATTTFFNG